MLVIYLLQPLRIVLRAVAKVVSFGTKIFKYERLVLLHTIQPPLTILYSHYMQGTYVCIHLYVFLWYFLNAPSRQYPFLTSPLALTISSQPFCVKYMCRCTIKAVIITISSGEAANKEPRNW